MPQFERVRESVFGWPSVSEIERRAQDGWSITAIEWTREITSQQPGAGRVQAVPYGLMVGPDCKQLIEDPAEKGAILVMLEAIVQDKGMREIADELNRQSFRMRSGAKWTPGAVFDLLPRLIEVGQHEFGTDEWASIRRGIFGPQAPQT